MTKWSEQEIYGNTSHIGQKNEKIFVFHVNPHRSMTSVEKNFNNQFYRVTHFGDTSQPLFSDTCIITQCITQKQTAMMGSYAWAQSHRLPLTKADLT